MNKWVNVEGRVTAQEKRWGLMAFSSPSWRVQLSPSPLSQPPPPLPSSSRPCPSPPTHLVQVLRQRLLQKLLFSCRKRLRPFSWAARNSAGRVRPEPKASRSRCSVSAKGSILPGGAAWAGAPHLQAPSTAPACTRVGPRAPPWGLTRQPRDQGCPTYTYTHTNTHAGGTLGHPLTELQTTPLNQWAGGLWTPRQSPDWVWACRQLLRGP